jgi:hypothetical protein
MLFRFFVVAYGVGVMLGFLGLVEWLVDRAGRVWIRHLAAALLAFTLGAVFWVASRLRTTR